jgi:two-component system, NarL family, response regulator YdfI
MGGDPARTVHVVRLVLVDNDESALELIQLDLALEGHEIVGTAAQGEEAIQVVEAVQPDLVVLDYRMPPGIDGLEAARRIRRRWPSVRVLLYSNYVRAELIRDAERMGATYLRKGDLAALRRAVIG